MRIRISIFTPKAFSMRRAISPESAALLLSKLERAGREALRAIAAAVTERPAGSMISVRMKSPGWGGFFMGMMALPRVEFILTLGFCRLEGKSAWSVARL